MKEAFYLALGIIGCTLGWFSLSVASYNLTLISVFISSVPLVYSAYTLMTPNLPSAKIVAGLSAIFAGVGVFCSVKSLED